MYLHKRDVIIERAGHYQIHPGNWQFLQPYFQTIVLAIRNDDFTGIDPAAWIKGELQQFRATPLPVLFIGVLSPIYQKDNKGAR